jgi:uncharacterized protein (DUF697 family)
MTNNREEAMRWVHRYAIGGAVLAALPLPFTAAGLVAIQARLIGTITEVYGEKSGGLTMGAMKAGFALAGQAVKFASRRAESAVPSAAKPFVRAAIAGATIEAMGLGLILFHENRSAGQLT